MKKHYRNQVLLTKLGVKIVEIREAKDITQEQLAEKLGIDTRQLGRIERGETNATISTLESVATVFSMDLSKLLEITLETSEKFELKIS